MSTWPFNWAAITALLLGIFSIVTCSPALANSPWSCATYRPARSTDGMAATVMSGCSSRDDAEAKVTLLGAVVHPARTMIVAAASGATRKFQVLIFPPEHLRAKSWPDASVGVLPATCPVCTVTVITAIGCTEGG